MQILDFCDFILKKKNFVTKADIWQYYVGNETELSLNYKITLLTTKI